MVEINEMIIACNTPDDPGPGNGGPEDSGTEEAEPENSGTVILDVTCALQNIRFPQAPHVLQERPEGLPEAGKVQKAHCQKDLQGSQAAAAVYSQGLWISGSASVRRR